MRKEGGVEYLETGGLCTSRQGGGLSTSPNTLSGERRTVAVVLYLFIERIMAGQDRLWRERRFLAEKLVMKREKEEIGKTYPTRLAISTARWPVQRWVSNHKGWRQYFLLLLKELKCNGSWKRNMELHARRKTGMDGCNSTYVNGREQRTA